jgi:hypothetical protein
LLTLCNSTLGTLFSISLLALLTLEPPSRR